MLNLHSLDEALRIFDVLKERGDMTVSLARTFLAVAAEQGITGKGLEKRLGISQGSLSRHLLDLGDRNRRMESGLKLVTWRIDPTDLRIKKWYLTERGQTLCNQLEDV